MFSDGEFYEQELKRQEEEELRIHEKRMLMEMKRVKYKKATTDKLNMDRFIIALSSGVHVRRHEAHHLAEVVRLYSNNGGRTIKWGPKVALDLANQRQRTHNENGSSVMYANTGDDNGFDCCFSVCGCGDDILTGNDSRPTNSHYKKTPTKAPAHSGCQAPPGATPRGINIEDCCTGLLSRALSTNWGYQYRGVIPEHDIIAVHPAVMEDPTKVGYYGTEGLRESKDVFNANFTFSVVYRKPEVKGLGLTKGWLGWDNDADSKKLDHVSGGVGAGDVTADLENQEKLDKADAEAAPIGGPSVAITLDIECETEEIYELLLRGFELLHKKALLKQAARLSHKDSKFVNGPVPNSRHSLVNWSFHPRTSTANQHNMDCWVHFDEIQNVDDDFMSPTTAEIKKRTTPVKNTDENEIQENHSRRNRLKKKKSNPIKKLFKPTVSVDPLRALGVGGGLLPVYHSKSKTNDPNASSPSLKSAAGLLPTGSFLGWNSAGTQIWSRLRMAGLEVKVVFSWDLRRIILKIKCPSERLEEVAEKMHLRIRRKDGTLRVFKRSKRDSFQPIAPAKPGQSHYYNRTSKLLFRSSERQQVIDFIIRSKISDGGAELDEDTPLGAFIVQRFPLHMYSRLEEIQHSWVTFWKMGSVGEVSKPWLLFSEDYMTAWHNNAANNAITIDAHDQDTADACNAEADAYRPPEVKLTYEYMMQRSLTSIEHFFSSLLTQPLDNIAEYYGEGVAFYFAFFSFYTRWLVIPSIVGLVVFCFQLSQNRLDNVYCVPYAILIMVWGSFMLVFWRQKSSALAYRWGVLEYEVEETERPQFRGEHRYDDATGEVRKVYPAWKRIWKYMVSVPVLCFTMGLMLVIMITVFSTQNKLFNQYMNNKELNYVPSNVVSVVDGSNNDGSSSSSGGGDMSNSTAVESPWTLDYSPQLLNDSDFWMVAIFYPCLYVVLVELFAAIVETLSIALNDFENHKTQSAYMNRLILKVFIFRFVSINMPLVYDAVTMKDAEEAYVRMSVMILCQMTVGVWWSVFLDVGVPALYQRLMLYHMKMNVAKANRKIYKAKEYSDALKLEAEENEDGNGNNNANFRKSLASVTSYSSLGSRRGSFGASTIEKRVRLLEQARSKCWEEALQPTYKVFGDYTQLIIQLGFVLLYAPVFPLAPLFALFSNLAIIRLNAFKLTYTRQRPVAQKVSGIGVWEDVLQLISIVGILANCALFGLVSYQLMNAFGGLGGSVTATLLLFMFEHGILFFKYWLHTSVPRIPLAVQRAQQRERSSTIDRKKRMTLEKSNRGGLKKSPDPNRQSFLFTPPMDVTQHAPFESNIDDITTHYPSVLSQINGSENNGNGVQNEIPDDVESSNDIPGDSDSSDSDPKSEYLRHLDPRASYVGRRSSVQKRRSSASFIDLYNSDVEYCEQMNRNGGHNEGYGPDAYYPSHPTNVPQSIPSTPYFGHSNEHLYGQLPPGASSMYSHSYHYPGPQGPYHDAYGRTHQYPTNYHSGYAEENTETGPVAQWSFMQNGTSESPDDYAGEGIHSNEMGPLRSLSGIGVMSNGSGDVDDESGPVHSFVPEIQDSNSYNETPPRSPVPGKKSRPCMDSHSPVRLEIPLPDRREDLVAHRYPVAHTNDDICHSPVGYSNGDNHAFPAARSGETGCIGKNRSPPRSPCGEGLATRRRSVSFDDRCRSYSPAAHPSELFMSPGLGRADNFPHEIHLPHSRRSPPPTTVASQVERCETTLRNRTPSKHTHATPTKEPRPDSMFSHKKAPNPHTPPVGKPKSNRTSTTSPAARTHIDTTPRKSRTKSNVKEVPLTSGKKYGKHLSPVPPTDSNSPAPVRARGMKPDVDVNRNLSNITNKVPALAPNPKYHYYNQKQYNPFSYANEFNPNVSEAP